MSFSESSGIGAKNFKFSIGGRCAGVNDKMVSDDATAALEDSVTFIGVKKIGLIATGDNTVCPRYHCSVKSTGCGC